MKLSEIVASLKELRETVTSFIGDKAKATTDALSQFSSKLTALESGAVAELTQAQSDLATSKQTISTLTPKADRADKAEADLLAVNAALKASCGALSLEVKEGATAAEMISALQGAVTSTLAKLQVNSANVPTAVPTKAGESKGDKKTATERCLEANKAKTAITK